MESYTFMQSEPTLAILPFLPLILALIYIFTRTTKIKGKSLGILGMQESGKTQLLRTLQEKPYTKYEATSTDDYSSFTVKINDKQIVIQKGRDIGGDERYIRPYYKDFIESKDVIFFVFDVKKYLYDTHYAQNVRNRLDFVHRKLQEKDESDINSKYSIIGSHLDQLSNSRQRTALKELQSSVSGKSYEELFHNNLLLCDLTDRTNLLLKLTELFE